MFKNIKEGPVTTILGVIWLLMATVVFWTHWPVDLELSKNLIGFAIGILLLFAPDTLLAGIKRAFRKKTSE